LGNELEPSGDAVKLTDTHEIERDGSKFIGAVSGGGPKILWGLKSLLEPGQCTGRSRNEPQAA
jgi:hypothetical protein